MPAQVQLTIDELAKHNKSYYDDDLTAFNSKRVRILGISPGKFNDLIICRLRTLPIRKDLAYGALSYAWGSNLGEEEITLNGQPGFKITTSVAGAIRRLRHHDRVRCLWVDAVCVDQANIHERSQQVALMADIFRFAELVYVWLGPCTGTVTETREQEVCIKHRIEWDGTLKLNSSTEATDDYFCEVKSGKLQWWWRTWAVQEVALGRKIAVVIGPHQLSWQKSREALEKCWFKARLKNDLDREPLREAFHQLDQIHTVRGKRSWICNHLRYLLQLTSSHVATDHRDKIYGVLGLLEAEKLEEIRPIPDYSKSYREVCRDATLYLIRSEESLDILLEDWQRLQEKPFWALDFAAGPRRPRSLLQRGDVDYFDSPQNVGNELSCTASKDLKASFEVDGDELVARGIHFDSIDGLVRFDADNLGSFTAEMDRSRTNRVPGRVFKNRDARQTSVSNDPWAMLHALEQLATALKDKVQLPLGTRGSQHGLMDVRKQFARTVTGDQYTEAYNLYKETSDLYREQAWRTLRGRTFFVTKRGFSGIGPPQAKIGDEIVVLLGASMPALLRGDGSSDKYRLVGECYIAGIMYGELLDSRDAGNDAWGYRLV